MSEAVDLSTVVPAAGGPARSSLMTPQQRAWIVGESRRRGVDVAQVIAEMFQEVDAGAAHRAVDAHPARRSVEPRRALPSPQGEVAVAGVEVEPVNGHGVHVDAPASPGAPKDVPISTLSELMRRARDYGLELVEPRDAARRQAVGSASAPSSPDATVPAAVAGPPPNASRTAGRALRSPERAPAVPPSRSVVPVQVPSSVAEAPAVAPVDPSPDLPPAVADSAVAASVAGDPSGARSLVLSGPGVSTESGVVMLLPGMGKDGGVGAVKVPLGSYIQRDGDSSRLVDFARGLATPVQYLLSGFVVFVVLAALVLAGFQVVAARYTFEEVQIAPGRSVFYKVDRWTGDMVRCDTTSRVVGSGPLC